MFEVTVQAVTLHSKENIFMLTSKKERNRNREGEREVEQAGEQKPKENPKENLQLLLLHMKMQK